MESMKIYTLAGYFCVKYVMFELKRTCVMKNYLRFQKWHKEFDEYLHKYLKVMSDKLSAYNILAEGMSFLTKIAHQI